MLTRFDIQSFVLIAFMTLGLGASLSWAEAVPDKPAEYFFYRCAGCHTIGGGKLSGPDLIVSAQWSSADLQSAVKKMEKNVGSMSEADVQQMVDFLKDISAPTRITRQKQKMEAKLRAELPPPSFAMGQKLFRGQKPLVNGGPSCISCHHFVNEGGNLGFDLTLVKDKVSGAALQSAVENSSYKVMRAIYEKHKITKEESFHLAEYLAHPEKVETRFAAALNHVIAWAGAGFCVFFALLWRLNRKRKGATRTNLIQKSRKR